MPRINRAGADVFEYQADATITQANPVSGTKYEVLATTKNVRLYTLNVACTWSVQPSPLEIHVTIDGQTPKADQANPGSTTNYRVYIRDEQADWEFKTGFAEHRAFLVEGRSVKIEGEITGGTVSQLASRVKYGKIP